MPTRVVMRALAVAVGATVAATGTGCWSYYPPPAQTQPRAQAASPAQVQGVPATRGLTRRDLEARASQLERDPRRRNEAAAIRARLRGGDFRVGDAIVLNVAGVPQFSDTFPVRAGLVIELPEIAPIPLSGVLRPELQQHMRQQIARYVINPTVEAHSLIRIGIAGAVARPGFYEVRPDAALSAVIMSAGGLAAQGDATKMSVRRAGRVVIPEAQVRTAVAAGATLDDMHIRAGDELRVEERARRDWGEVARAAAYIVAAITGIWAATR